ncbi:hypothetical protein ACPB8Q_05015 [Methanocaldococcus indicus]|uniref:hypothetical protein n=1 Tax=Methanocaldococcus indicus TaxID=213231 RepID=UPI003C6D4FBB
MIPKTYAKSNEIKTTNIPSIPNIETVAITTNTSPIPYNLRTYNIKAKIIEIRTFSGFIIVKINENNAPSMTLIDLYL